MNTIHLRTSGVIPKLDYIGTLGLQDDFFKPSEEVYNLIPKFMHLHFDFHMFVVQIGSSVPFP